MKTNTILIIAVLSILAWYLFLRKKPVESNYRMSRKPKRKIGGLVYETYGTVAQQRVNNNPITDCITRCSASKPYEYCVSYCTGGQDTTPPPPAPAV